uniref:B30.2/SPRY domain-containing protein n=1 Tax=Sinocyclocheilus rhinocerous TaxID=307959 RepID=A0A673JJZ5_9TELE
CCESAGLRICPSAERQTGGFLQRGAQEDLRQRCVLSPSDSHQLTLDPNTAYKRLRLSENNRVVTVTAAVQSYPDHPDRFDYWYQVLCRESVCGRCYWEQEWSGNNGVYISVLYKSISRKGRSNECLFGCNDQSWNLDCSPSSYSFTHNNIRTDLPVKSISSRIGVFVDHSAGTLSFYSVSDTMSLIHTVQTTFTQPLYPGFGNRLTRDSTHNALSCMINQ